MRPPVTLRWNGRQLSVPAGTTVAAALWNAGARAFRDSVAGTPRAPLCGMGTCFECRATVDGVAGVRTCILPVRDGMEVRTPVPEAGKETPVPGTRAGDEEASP